MRRFIFKVAIWAVLISAPFVRCETEDGGAIVKGVVTLSGPIPELKDISIPADIQNERAQMPLLKDERIVVSATKSLANVVVYVSKGYERYSLAPDNLTKEIRSKGYHFIPHVIAIEAKQKLMIISDDKATHNWHAISHTNPDEAVVKPGDQNNVRVFPLPELGISLRCDVYGWMRAYVCVFPHPFFAVTKADGTYEIKLPPGEFELSFWHESKQIVLPETQKINVSADQPTVLNFEAKIGIQR